MLNISGDERISAILPVKKNETKDYLTMVTKNGIIKKTERDLFANIRSNGIIAITLDEGDELISVFLADDHEEIVTTTSFGMAIRINMDDVRPTGRNARGVKLINLDKDDRVVSSDPVMPNAKLLTISENGYGKLTPIDEYKVQNRGGKGLITYKVTKRTGNVITSLVIYEEKDLLLISSTGTIIRIDAKEIRETGRNTSGVKLMDLKDETIISAIQTEE